MRGTVAKRIRKEVYGDNSIVTRTYDYGDTRINTGFRREYLKAKKEYYAKK